MEARNGISTREKQNNEVESFDDAIERYKKLLEEVKPLQEARQKYSAELDKKKAAIEELYKSLGNKRPICPQCGKPLFVRKWSNKYFWGCNNFKNHKNSNDKNDKAQYIDFPSPVIQEIAELSQIKNGLQNDKKEITNQIQQKLNPKRNKVRVASRTLNKYEKKQITYDVYPETFEQFPQPQFIFQSLAIPPELFEQKSLIPDLQYFTRFFIQSSMEKQTVSPYKRTIYSLSLRLLNRGTVLPENHKVLNELRKKFFKKKNGCVNSLFTYGEYSKPEYVCDSKEEFDFLAFLPGILGKQWATYVLSQVGFDLLIPGSVPDKEFRRTDFLIIKNGKKIIIEVDGSQHETENQKTIDHKRDTVLCKYGYTVLRFPTSEIRNNSELVKQTIENALGPEKYRNIPTTIDDKYLVATKLVHQIEIAIVKALEQGYINESCNLQINCMKSFFSEQEINFIFTLAKEEVRDIIHHFSEIYGDTINIDFCDKQQCETCICIGDGGSEIPCRILIRDCFLPGNFLCRIDPFDVSVLPKNCNSESIVFFLDYIFGFQQFRQGQREAVERFILRKDSVVLLPTGAGKSIIYQLSSLLVPGITIVVSPLRALIDDQIGNLDLNFGIKNVIGIKSGNQKQDKNNKNNGLLTRIKNSSLSMVYIAPERLQIKDFRHAIDKLKINNIIYAVAVDEAHCVSEWGHDFRPAYLYVSKVTRGLFSRQDYTPTIIALTGTASEHVLHDVQASLEITQDDAIIRPTSFDRPELHFSVISCSSDEKAKYIAQLITKKLPKQFNETKKQFFKVNDSNMKSGIVFTPFTNSLAPSYGALNMWQELKRLIPDLGSVFYFSKKPECFESETWETLLKNNAELFKNNKTNLLVATKAFGMGIDKSNIRFVIHAGLPSSIEAYYQEAGRAGRGRENSYCYIIASNDVAKENEKWFTKNISREQNSSEGKKFIRASNKKDDLSSVIYFHEQAFKGVDYECSFIEKVLANISEKEFKEDLPFGFFYKKELQITIEEKTTEDDASKKKTATKITVEDPEKEWQKAVLRLISLGVLKEDYTLNYNDKRFDVKCGTLDRDTIIKKYYDYIKNNNRQKATEEKRKVSEISSHGYDFVLDVARQMIEYIYGYVEEYRKTAAKNMYDTVKEAAKQKDQDEFIRKAILDYLSLDNINDLKQVRELENAGLSLVKTFVNLYDASDYSAIERGDIRTRLAQLNHQLEDFPDQPSYLMLKALFGIVLKNTSKEQTAEDIAASIVYSQTRYSVSDEALFEEGGSILVSVMDTNPDIFDLVLKKLRGGGYSPLKLLEHMMLNPEVTEASRDYLLLAYLNEKLQEGKGA